MTGPDDGARELAAVRAELRSRLCTAGLLIPGPVAGQYGRGAEFTRVLDSISALVTEHGARYAAADASAGGAPHPGAYAVVRFPPVYPREQFEKTDYIASFPDLTGTISTFTGGDREHAALLADRAAGRPWDVHLEPTDSVLVPATCHPLYPTLTGTLPAEGAAFDVMGWAFRHEPSADPMRMQAFHIHEFVRVAAPEVTREHQRVWVDRAADLLAELGLRARAEAANDPFFGRAGRILAAGQRQESLKTELIVHAYGEGLPGTAVASSNNHQTHFGEAFAIHTPDGEVAHSTCVGFGLERITVALFGAHGTDPGRWPDGIRSALGW